MNGQFMNHFTLAHTVNPLAGLGVVQMEQQPRAIGARLSSPVSSSLLAKLAFFGVTEGIGLLAIEI